jgi:hypothetical protein
MWQTKDMRHEVKESPAADNNKSYECSHFWCIICFSSTAYFIAELYYEEWKIVSPI